MLFTISDIIDTTGVRYDNIITLIIPVNEEWTICAAMACTVGSGYVLPFNITINEIDYIEWIANVYTPKIILGRKVLGGSIIKVNLINTAVAKLGFVAAGIVVERKILQEV